MAQRNVPPNERSAETTASSTTNETRDSKLKAAWLGWKHALMGVETTDLHQSFVRMYEEAKEFGKMTKTLIQRVRNVTQHHPEWHKTLIPPSDEYTDYDYLSEELNKSSDGLKTRAPKAAEFYKKQARVVNEVNKFYIQFLVNVKANTIKPMEKYITEDLEQIKLEYDKLVRFKKLYDEGRNKLKTCRAENIEDAAAKLNATKVAFESQAELTTELLRKIPDHMEKQRLAMRQFALAQHVYFEKAKEVLTKMLQDTRE